MKIIFAGTPVFAAQALAALLPEHDIVAVLTQPDRPAGRGMQLTASPVKQLALQHGLTVMQPTTLRTDEAAQAIAALNADVMVVAAYGLILPQRILTLPRLGCLNIHASLLPRWRGAAPIQRAIQAGDATTGITIMQMDVGLDTGDMLLREVTPIAATDTAALLHDKLAAQGAHSIVQALRQLPQLTPEKQDATLATYASKLLKSEAMIDWSLDAHVIERAVRAFNPFPTCQTQYQGAMLKVWQSSVVDGVTGQAGEIIALDKHGITVACGQHGLRLETVQRAGGKPQAAGQLAQMMKVGAFLGEEAREKGEGT
ncbi:MAG: methionyl-tRNA formyltransferase [Gallionella sp.]